jgi:hypothetical protein
MRLLDKIKTGGIVVVSTFLLGIIVSFAAWITHIVTCFQNGEWGFLLVGALFFPIAVIHGIGVWFGLWT